MRVFAASAIAAGLLILSGSQPSWNSARGAPLKLQASNGSVECAIRVQPGKDLVRFEAVVRSTSPVEGRYAFSISKRSESGTSQNNQSGTFALTGEGELVLTTVMLDRSALGHYQAQLSLNSGLGNVSCVSP